MSRVHAAWSRLGRPRLFAIALLLGMAVRVITMLGFPPAIWFGGDSASYTSTALRLAPATSRVSGYGLMLLALRPFHSYALVTAVQHLMGLAIAVMLYAVARRYGLPGWAATLATLPVLLDAYELQLEHEILPSVPFGFLVMTAVTLTLWWRKDRPAWATATAGVLLALSGIVWPVGLPLLAVFLLYLLVRRAGWRRIGATALASAVPLAGYLLWFNHTYQQLTFTNSDGIYLWSRTMTFANCAVIKPPASEQVLCPHQPVADRPSAGAFIWEPGSLLNNLPTPKFSAANNALAMDFALRAIKAQPGGYLSAVVRGVGLSFTWTRPDYPSANLIHRYEFSYATMHWIAPDYALVPGHTVAMDQRAYGGITTTRLVAPFDGWLRGYQRFVYLRGTLLAVIMLVGLAGIARGWSRGGIRRLDGWGGPALLPWAAAVTLLVVPVMTADFDLRYVQISVPVACLAAALAFIPRGSRTAAAAVPGAVTAAGQPPAAEPAGDGGSGEAVPPLPQRRKDPAGSSATRDQQPGN